MFVGDEVIGADGHTLTPFEVHARQRRSAAEEPLVAADAQDQARPVRGVDHIAYPQTCDLWAGQARVEEEAHELLLAHPERFRVEDAPERVEVVPLRLSAENRVERRTA